MRRTVVEIETARLHYRMLNSRDVEDLFILFHDSEVMKYIGIEAGTMPSREETQNLVEKMLEFWTEHGFGRWAVENKADGKLIGLCGFRLLESTPELFYMLAREHWGKGLATEAARASLRFGFEERGFERVRAVTRHANVTSIKIMKKLGMRYEKEINHSGISAVCYLATRDQFQVDDSPYILLPAKGSEMLPS